MEQPAARKEQSARPASEPTEQLAPDYNPHRSAMILSIVGGILLLILLAVAGWFFICYDTPQRATADAMAELLQSDQTLFEGTVSVFDTDSAEHPILPFVMLNINFAAKAALPSVADASFEFALSGSNNPITFDATAIIDESGMIYVKLADVWSALNDAKLDEKTLTKFEDYFVALELADNEWWGITSADLAAVSSISRARATQLDTFYRCALESDAESLKADLANLYQKTPFLEATSDFDGSHPTANAWQRVYKIDLQKDALSKFINQLAETPTADEFYTCYNSIMQPYYDPDQPYLDATEIDELSAEDLSLPEDFELFFEIGIFDHQFKSIQGQFSQGQIMYSYYVQPYYDETAKVNLPDSYRPILDLFEELNETMEVEE